MSLAKKRILGISIQEFVAILMLYLLFSWMYHLVLKYNGNGNLTGAFNFRSYWYTAGMQYTCYLVESLIIYLLGIRLLKQKGLLIQILVVFVLILTLTYVVREVRYIYLDYKQLSRLSGTGEIWDWYIPTLFLTVQFGCIFAYRYIVENQRKLKLEAELRQAALKSELSAIKAQLNPHFLYNVFNTINASLPPENEKTRMMIAQLSDLFRYQLKASKEELVPLREELDFVKSYLDLEKARFENRLTVKIEVPQALYDVKIPPMLLQPLVENSLKHGLADLVEGGEIRIKIYKEENKLYFEVADTGVGIADKSLLFDKGVGLTNTNLRLEKMYHSSLHISDNQPRGTKVAFAI